MVSEEEIEKVSKLMRIEIDDHKEYVEKVHSMIDYFDILELCSRSKNRKYLCRRFCCKDY
jgi:Asp-tRNA(Asn)/Glu-tRNA(Gln) amidotransferase C subunit